MVIEGNGLSISKSTHSNRKQRARGLYGKKQRRSNREVFGIDIALENETFYVKRTLRFNLTHPSGIRRNRRERPLLTWCYAHLTSKRPDRDLDRFLRVIKPRNALLATNLPHLQLRLGELVREEAKARDQARPAPFCRLDRENVDLERVAGGGGGDVDGAVDLVELAEYDGGECGVCGGGCDLAVARVEAVERDGIARVYRDHRWDAGSCV